MQSCTRSDSGAVVTHHYTTPLNDLPDMHKHVYTCTHMHRDFKGFYLYHTQMYTHKLRKEGGRVA